LFCNGYVADSEFTPTLSPKYFINIRDEEFYGQTR
jgi:hypothetical protein